MRASSSVFVAFILGTAVTASACGSSSGHSQSSSGSMDGGSGDGAAGSGDSSGASGSSSGGEGGISDAGKGGSDAGGSSSGSDSGGESDAGPVAPFPFPPVIDYGGPLVTVPKVVTITFPADSLASQLDTFGASVTSSSYWDSIRAGYCSGGNCIGDGAAGTSIALTTSPATSYTDSSQGGASTLQTFLAGLVSAQTVPAPDANTIDALYFPTTTTITLDGAVSCQDFDGYHGSTTIGSQAAYYAVIPECTAPGVTTLQNTTITASHEFIETSSDPADQQTAFYLNLKDAATWAWDDIQGGEIADLCVDQFGLAQDETTENGYTVQRIWSMTNAAAGKNPCVPIPSGEVYFNAYSKDSVVVMDVGQSKTVEVDALADGPIAPWTVFPEDWTSVSSTYLSFSIQGGNDAGIVQVQSGDRIQVQVTLLADPSTAPYGEADAVLVSANAQTGAEVTKAHFWPFIVLTTAEAAKEGVSTMRRPHRTHARPKRSLR